MSSRRRRRTARKGSGRSATTKASLDHAPIRSGVQPADDGGRLTGWRDRYRSLRVLIAGFAAALAAVFGLYSAAPDSVRVIWDSGLRLRRDFAAECRDHLARKQADGVPKSGEQPKETYARLVRDQRHFQGRIAVLAVPNTSAAYMSDYRDAVAAVTKLDQRRLNGLQGLSRAEQRERWAQPSQVAKQHAEAARSAAGSVDVPGCGVLRVTSTAAPVQPLNPSPRAIE